MNKPWLVIDANYLAHRAYHALGDWQFNEEPSSVVFGFLRDVTVLLEEFQTDRAAFCFDCGFGKRTELLPTYKHSRIEAAAEWTEEERQSRSRFRGQVRKLRERYLRMLGWRNVFWQEGYEADDMVASVVRWSLGEDDAAVIVSSDHDLWQLIGASVWCYNPQTKRQFTREDFVAEYGIEPCMWAHVKALAGCGGDDVPGIRGIGEKTAAKWFAGKLNPRTKTYKKIDENLAIHNRNFPLVKLPFEGRERFELQRDAVDLDGWARLADKLNMPAIKQLAPGMPRGVKKRRRGFGF